MKNLLVFAFLLIVGSIQLNAQKYFVREGKVSFYSDAPVEKIEASNNSATSVIDAESGKMEFAVLIKAFQFEKALMQEHFNENYMESSKFPKAKFKGMITNNAEVDYTKDGTYPVTVKGDLTIHGVTQPVEVSGEISVVNGIVNAKAKFEVAVADYDIKIPAVVQDNIAKTVLIDVDIENYQVLAQ